MKSAKLLRRKSVSKDLEVVANTPRLIRFF